MKLVIVYFILLLCQNGELFCASGVVVKSELRRSVPCGNDDMQLVEDGGLSQWQAYHISLSKLVVKVGAVFRWHVWPIVAMWPGRPVVVPNVVVLYDDISAFVSVFGRFPAMNRSISLLLNQ
jgi:hypothetical protein